MSGSRKHRRGRNKNRRTYANSFKNGEKTTAEVAILVGWYTPEGEPDTARVEAAAKEMGLHEKGMLRVSKLDEPETPAAARVASRQLSLGFARSLCADPVTWEVLGSESPNPKRAQAFIAYMESIGQSGPFLMLDTIADLFGLPLTRVLAEFEKGCEGEAPKDPLLGGQGFADLSKSLLVLHGSRAVRAYMLKHYFGLPVTA